MKEAELQSTLSLKEWKSQKKVDGLMEVLRFEQDELEMIRAKKEKLKDSN